MCLKSSIQTWDETVITMVLVFLRFGSQTNLRIWTQTLSCCEARNKDQKRDMRLTGRYQYFCLFCRKTWHQGSFHSSQCTATQGIRTHVLQIWSVDGQVSLPSKSLPVTCLAADVMQPDRQCATCQAWYDNVGVHTVERLDPKDLSTLVSALSSRHTGDSNSFLHSDASPSVSTGCSTWLCQ
jgi:hypothetical protein